MWSLGRGLADNRSCRHEVQSSPQGLMLVATVRGPVSVGGGSTEPRQRRTALTDDDDEVEAIAAGTRYLLRSRQERARLLDGLLKAVNQSETVQALVHASESAAEAQPRLMDLLNIDQVQARAVLDMQWRRLAVADRRALADEYQRLAAEIAEYELILVAPDKQRDLVGTERGEELARYANPDGSPS